MKLPRWQKEQKLRKEKRRFKLAQKVFWLIVLAIFSGIFYQIKGSFDDSCWDGKNRFTLILYSDQIIVFSLDPAKEKLSILKIPNNTLVNAIYGYGPYQAGSLLRLGQLESLDIDFFSKTFREYLGIPVEGWLAANQLQMKFDNSEEAKLSFVNLVIKLFCQHKDTNLTRWDLLRLWFSIKKVRLNNIDQIDLEQSGAISKELLADGSQVYATDYSLLDQLVSRHFSDSKIRDEGLAIGVYNATSSQGLARQVARIIVNSGGRVMEVGDQENQDSGCMMQVVKSASGSYTAQKLKKVLGCQSVEKPEGGQADLILVLGESYWQELYCKPNTPNCLFGDEGQNKQSLFFPVVGSK